MSLALLGREKVPVWPGKVPSSLLLLIGQVHLGGEEEAVWSDCEPGPLGQVRLLEASEALLLDQLCVGTVGLGGPDGEDEAVGLRPEELLLLQVVLGRGREDVLAFAAVGPEEVVGLGRVGAALAAVLRVCTCANGRRKLDYIQK